MSARFDVIALAAGRIAQSMMLFATYRALTYLLPQVEVGQYFFLLAITGAVGLIIVNPGGVFLFRFIHSWVERRTLSQKLNSFMMFAAGAALIAFLLTLVSQTQGTRDFMGTALAVSVFVFGTTLSNTFLPALNLLHRPKLFAALNVSCLALTLAVTIYVAPAHPLAYVWLGVTGLVNILFGAIGFILLRSVTRSPVPSALTPPTTSSNYLNFALPLMAANVGTWFLTQGYRPVSERMLGLEALSIIGLGLGLASSIGNAFESFAHQLYLPKFYQLSHQADAKVRNESWQKIWFRLIPMYFAIAMFVTGFSVAIVRILSPGAYADAWIYLSIGAWIEFFRMSCGLVLLHNVSELQTKQAIRPYLEGALICFIGMLASGWIAIPILIGNIYALGRLMFKVRKSVSLLKFSKAAQTLAAISVLFLVPLFLKEKFNEARIAFASLAVFGPILLILLLRSNPREMKP